MVSVDAQRFVDAPGGPGGGQGERETVGAGGEGVPPDGQIRVAGLNGEDFERGVVIRKEFDGARYGGGWSLGWASEAEEGSVETSERRKGMPRLSFAYSRAMKASTSSPAL